MAIASKELEMAYDNTNKGILGKNKDKSKETHHEYKGQINVDGVEYWLSAWVKTNSKDNSKFFSLSLTPKDRDVQAPTRRDVQPEEDDQIPF